MLEAQKVQHLAETYAPQEFLAEIGAQSATDGEKRSPFLAEIWTCS